SCRPATNCAATGTASTQPAFSGAVQRARRRSQSVGRMVRGTAPELQQELRKSEAIVTRTVRPLRGARRTSRRPGVLSHSRDRRAALAAPPSLLVGGLDQSP